MGRKDAHLFPLPPSSQIATHTLAQYPHARNTAFLLGTYPDVVEVGGDDLCVHDINVMGEAKSKDVSF